MLRSGIAEVVVTREIEAIGMCYFRRINAEGRLEEGSFNMLAHEAGESSNQCSQHGSPTALFPCLEHDKHSKYLLIVSWLSQA